MIGVMAPRIFVRVTGCLLAVWFLGGCGRLPRSGADRMNAIGMVTISPPLFRPITGGDDGTCGISAKN